MGRIAYIEAGVAVRRLQRKAARHNSQSPAGFRPIRRAALGGHNQLDISLDRQCGG
jgi:FAD/FMN-containing dehydrogenase